MTLSRKTQLRPNPEKVREFIQRGRESSRLGRAATAVSDFRDDAGRPIIAATQRTPTQQRRLARRAGGKRRATIPKRVRARVFARSDGLCVCGCGRPCDTVHHVLEVNRWPHLELIEANMVGVYHDCNWAHHFSPNGRMSRSCLPQCVRDLVRELGPKAEAELERYYAA